jgi:hypothetical protein
VCPDEISSSTLHSSIQRALDLFFFLLPSLLGLFSSSAGDGANSKSFRHSGVRNQSVQLDTTLYTVYFTCEGKKKKKGGHDGVFFLFGFLITLLLLFRQELQHAYGVLVSVVEFPPWCDGRIDTPYLLM